MIANTNNWLYLLYQIDNKLNFTTMASTAFEKQDRIIGQMNRIARQPETPSFIEREMAKQKPSIAKTEPVRISFYNPTNPLNGFKGKSRSEQIALKASLKNDKNTRPGDSIGC